MTARVAHLLSDEGTEERLGIERAIRAFAMPDANRVIYQDLKKLADKKK
jgi:hypothetical protein